MALLDMESFCGSTLITNFGGNNPNRRYHNPTWCTIQSAIGPRSAPGMRIAFDGITFGVGSWGLSTGAASGIGPLASGGVLGARMSFSSASSGQYGAITLSNSDATAAECTINRASDGTLNLRRGDGTGTIVASSAAGAIPADTFGFLEWKWNGIGTSQTVSVRWNGVVILSASAVNIQGGTGTHTVGSVRWYGRCDTQDVYLLDLAGSAPFNDFLGDHQVLGWLPTAAAATAWTPATSTNLSQINVGGAARPAAPSHNKAASADLEDRFTFTPGLAGNRIVRALQTRICALDTVSSGATMAGRIKSGGTTQSGATATPPITTPIYQADIWLTDPNTGNAWLPAAANAVEVGYRTIAVTSGEARACQVLLEALVSSTRRGPPAAMIIS